jgi:hypothetical protein
LRAKLGVYYIKSWKYVENIQILDSVENVSVSI